ncbi:MAG TPA: hypothetical protein VLC46_18670 [Thermoanaerobaculia bacterium]|jgi:hypothetical protein|nr:hypothetical protein [Thermoanaerobaculia bacterium]
MRSFRLALLTLALASPAIAQSAFQLHGFLSAREIYTSGQPSWLEGGFGRFDTGASGVNDHRILTLGAAQVGADWTPVSWLNLHASGVARRDQPGAEGKRTGLVDAYVNLHSEHFDVRAGQFFLATSRENTGPLWTSPYTVNFSPLNSWIGEEFRPVGIDLAWRPNLYVTAAATAFRNNDTLGALLAWRGWSVGNRLTVYDEVLPLPPLFSLPTTFAKQRHDGTVPFERDLDGRTGISARLRLQLPERAMAQVTHVDNRGERDEYRGEYAWQTRFNIAAAQVGLTSPATIATEYCWGKTGMGDAPRFVQADFATWYILTSYKLGNDRYSIRFDTFSTKDRDGVAENNSEQGHSWVLAWMHDLTPNVRLGTEFAQITGNRPAALQSGFNPDTDGRMLTLEVRYGF